MLQAMDQQVKQILIHIITFQSKLLQQLNTNHLVMNSNHSNASWNRKIAFIFIKINNYVTA